MLMKVTENMSTRNISRHLSNRIFTINLSLMKINSIRRWHLKSLKQNAIREMQTELNNFVVTNAIKYADPIDWNITKQYEKNTVVIDANSGIAYLSVDPVPPGVAITNTDYWTVIFDL